MPYIPFDEYLNEVKEREDALASFRDETWRAYEERERADQEEVRKLRPELSRVKSRVTHALRDISAPYNLRLQRPTAEPLDGWAAPVPTVYGVDVENKYFNTVHNFALANTGTDGELYGVKKPDRTENGIAVCTVLNGPTDLDSLDIARPYKPMPYAASLHGVRAALACMVITYQLEV